MHVGAHSQKNQVMNDTCARPTKAEAKWMFDIESMKPE